MDKLKALWGEASTLGHVVIVGTFVLIVLIALGAVFGESEDGGDGNTTSATREVESRTDELRAAQKAKRELRATREEKREREAVERQEAERKQKKARQREQETRQQSTPSAEQRVREALGDTVSSGVAVGDSEVRSVNVSGPLVDVILSTPEGGFQGPSSDDTDGLASAALAKVYGDADWHGTALVEFRGGLVNAATGRPLPNAPTAIYRMQYSAAKRIDWSDEEALFNIDWGIYRGLCHPALKGC